MTLPLPLLPRHVHCICGRTVMSSAYIMDQTPNRHHGYSQFYPPQHSEGRMHHRHPPTTDLTGVRINQT